MAFYEGVRRRRAALGVLASAVFLSACAGANIFESFAVSDDGAGGGATVEITRPTEGFTVTQGASLEVEALVQAPNGLGTVTVFGVYKADGTPAYLPESLTFQGANAAEVFGTLAATNAGPGAVYVIAELTDAVGEVVADSVSITIN